MKTEKVLNALMNEYNEYSFARAIYTASGNKKAAAECAEALVAISELLDTLCPGKYETVLTKYTAVTPVCFWKAVEK